MADYKITRKNVEKLEKKLSDKNAPKLEVKGK